MTLERRPKANALGVVDQSDPGFRGLYAIAILVALAINLHDLSDGKPFLSDVDDVLRGLQVKQLLLTGNWFDRTLSFIAMPEPYISPWSRLVDLPYVVIAGLLQPLVGPDIALASAFQVWPPVMLLIFCFLIVNVSQALLPTGEKLRPVPLVAMMLCLFMAISEFAPGRIDHHNVQMLLLMAMISGILRWSRGGGIVAGVACALSVAVGLELLPVVAEVFLVLALCWIAGRPGSGTVLKALGISVGLSAPAVAFLLIGPSGMTQTACDTYSAPYVVALMGYGGIVALAACLMSKAAPLVRLLAMAVAGVALIAMLAVLFPSCLAGPYAVVDPVSQSLWLDRIEQEHSLLIFIEQRQLLALGLLCALGLVLALSLPQVISAWREQRTGVLVAFATTVAILLLAAWQTRYLRFGDAFVPLFVPVILVLLNKAPRFAAGISVAILGIFAVAGIVSAKIIPPDVRGPDVIDFLAQDLCPDVDVSGLAMLPPGRIIAPLPLSLKIAGQLPPGMTVAAISFHRASPGIRRVYTAFALENAEARRQALAPFDYVAVCAAGIPKDVGVGSLFAATSPRRDMAWALTAV